MRNLTSALFSLVLVLSFVSSPLSQAFAQAEDDDVLTVSEGTFTDPRTHQGFLTLKNTSNEDVYCDARVTGIIVGRTASGTELEASQESDAVINFHLRAGRSQERAFDFKNAVMRMRARWGDDSAVLSKIDRSSLTSQCRNASTGPTGMCTWRDATVKEYEWLECPDCVYRYCQCQPNGKWGNCKNTTPAQGACDWSNPDWSNPSCSQGGSTPCDWNNPDWSNPSCSGRG